MSGPGSAVRPPSGCTTRVLLGRPAASLLTSLHVSRADSSSASSSVKPVKAIPNFHLQPVAQP
ncbi:hypothetical protein PF005_g21699 [Phytophthora fragariae]|uniref:Uncharacterized protein n=1 Tax=Phytophthora fragariae TaxID=53985 RepID=A0A6A3Y485_9STRA|nr:hypothetical protein PF003_g10702 [Phytophthora fragariae]KAE8927054.1 hypothetical protein PF009_g22771 [Phytophthora fragariae]KAE9087900.1 hypothetical protein PF007_g20191 [Phytophthora fragariae]KAE9106942.1 hypothetical protein PF006_g21241 [Phytophthora fragariae]KAE9184370.1 hypothetical protein PF005_g21699 [Phytophthora fragariae]